jgi:hypothetical protein
MPIKRRNTTVSVPTLSSSWPTAITLPRWRVVWVPVGEQCGCGSDTSWHVQVVRWLSVYKTPRGRECPPPLREVLAQLERQQARLLDFYLAKVIERDEFERKRKEVAQTQQGLTQQLRQLDAQAQQHVDVAALAQGIEAFCRRTQLTLDSLTFSIWNRKP